MTIVAHAYREAAPLRHRGRDAPWASLCFGQAGVVAARAAGKMPVAVMADNAFSFKKLLDQCENQELEVARQGGRSGGRRFQGNGPGRGLLGAQSWLIKPQFLSVVVRRRFHL